MLEKLPAQVRIADDVMCQTIDDDLVLLNMSTQEFYALDAAGAEIWGLLSENSELAVVATQLCRDYSGDPAAIQNDFYALVGSLIELGLMKSADV